MVTHLHNYCNFTNSKTPFMFRILTLLLPLASLILLSSDQDVLAELLTKHHKYVDVKKYEKIETIKKTGIIKRGSIDFPFTSYQKGSSFRLEEKFGDKTAISVFNDKKAWKTTPWKPDEVVELGGKELVELKELSLAAGVLVGFESLGYEASLLETKETEPNAQIRLSVTDKSWYIVWLNKTTGVIDAWDFHDKSTGRKTKVRTELGESMEYKGVQFPAMLKKKVGGKVMTAISTNTIETNINISDKLFKKP